MQIQKKNIYKITSRYRQKKGTENRNGIIKLA